MKHTEFSLSSYRGRSLFAQSWLPDERPQAVMGIVHGLGDHSGRYQAMARWLVQKGIGVVSYDQLGHGRTGGDMPHFETLVRDIEVLIDHLHRFKAPRFLYGQSLGGGLVTYVALKQRAQLEGVIAASPLLKTTQEPPAWKIAIGKSLGKFWPTLTLPTDLNPAHLTHDPVEADNYRTDPLIRRRVSAALGISMLEAGRWSMGQAKKLSVPMLMMHGTEDAITCSRASAAFAAAASHCCEWKAWQGLYHDLHHELDREDVFDFVVRWIRQRSQTETKT